MNLTREQLEAWCALEGLRLAGTKSTADACAKSNGFRVVRIGHEPNNTMLDYECTGVWVRSKLSAWFEHQYYPISWTELPEQAYNSLTLELLQQIKNPTT